MAKAARQKSSQDGQAALTDGSAVKTLEAYVRSSNGVLGALESEANLIGNGSKRSIFFKR